ncbi:MAG: hypothetical protein VX822_02380 [Candidatus Neomarinimicrobiota bacterium]|nr:hypothetical protein [Candidatus Neomarinimicrobiota bacterium]
MIPLRERKKLHRTNRLSLSLLIPVLFCSILGAQPSMSEWKQLSQDNVISKTGFTADKITVGPFGDIYLLDSGRSLLARLSSDGSHVRTVGGWGEVGELFSAGVDLAASYGLEILLLDSDTHRLIRFDRQLNFLDEINLLDREYGVEFPVALARNRAGEVAVASDTDDRVTLMNLGGDVLSVMGDEKYGNERFGQITAVGTNSLNEIAVIDEEVRLVVLNRSGMLLWHRKIATEVSFLESMGDSWLVGSEDGKFILVNRDSQTPVEQMQSVPVTVTDVAVEGKRLFILEERGFILVSSLILDE